MPTVWIPAQMRHLAHSQESVEVPGATVRELIDALEVRYPGIKARLCQGESVRSGLAVVIDTQVARGGLSESVKENSEVHFIPAIAGGSGSVAAPRCHEPRTEKAEPHPAVVSKEWLNEVVGLEVS